MIKWKTPTLIKVRGHYFRVTTWGAAEAPRLQVMKEPFHIDTYGALAKQIGTGANIVELGIRTGASTAFLAVLFKPAKLCGVEIADEASAKFDQFLQKNKRYAARISTHFGCDQGDRESLERIINHDFGDAALDLVIDDASHLLAPSTSSFNTLFPRLRPGGIFVLEDWSWEHFLESQAGAEKLTRELDGFSTLCLQAVVASGFRPDIISKVTIERGIAVIHRGEAELDPESFRLDQCIGKLGESFLQSGPYTNPVGVIAAEPWG